MRMTRAALAASLTAALLALSSPAQAQHITVTDPAGDASGPRPGLDITSVAFHNRDRAIVVDFTFVRDVPGNVIVGLRTRRGLAAVAVSKHRRQGADSTFLVRHRKQCQAMSSDWNRSTATLRMRVPARCIQRGNYGAVKAWALIERLHDGADVDYAPETPTGHIAFTDWIPRG